MDKWVYEADIEAGKLYRIEWNDCCTSGMMYARAIGYDVPPDSGYDYKKALFDCGYGRIGWADATFHEIEEPPNPQTVVLHIAGNSSINHNGLVIHNPHKQGIMIQVTPTAS